MKATVLPATLMMIVGFAGCSGEYSLSSNKSVVTATENETAGVIGPHIPALVITARRMSAIDKRAYDQGIHTLVTALESGRQP